MPGYPYKCRLCGAPIEVRVAFKGYLVWTVESGHSEFSEAPPELRGQHKEPQLVCSADVLHTTGFKLVGGEIVASPLGS